MKNKFCKIRLSDDNIQLINITNIIYIEYIEGNVLIKMNDNISYEFELSKDEFSVWIDEITNLNSDDHQSEINSLKQEIRRLKKGEDTYRTEAIQLLEGMVEDYYKQLEEEKEQIKEKDLKISELESMLEVEHNKNINHMIERGLIKIPLEEDILKKLNNIKF